MPVDGNDCSMCRALHVDTLEGLLDVSADRTDNIVHNVTYVRPNGIVSNIRKQGQYSSSLILIKLLFIVGWLIRAIPAML